MSRKGGQGARGSNRQKFLAHLCEPDTAQTAHRLTCRFFQPHSRITKNCAGIWPMNAWPPSFAVGSVYTGTRFDLQQFRGILSPCRIKQIVKTGLLQNIQHHLLCTAKTKLFLFQPLLHYQQCANAAEPSPGYVNEQYFAHSVSSICKRITAFTSILIIN